MQIRFENPIYNKTNFNIIKPKKDVTSSNPLNVSAHTPAFMGTNFAQKTVTSKINQEKGKLLKHLKEILATNVPILSEEDKMYAMMRHGHNLINARARRLEQINLEIDCIDRNPMLTAKQKADSLRRLLKEINQLEKTIIKPLKFDTTRPNEDYDYALINKFKNAILENNFDLETIFLEHYNGLNNIQSLEELKEKYPTIKVPNTPGDVIAKKIIEVLPRDFYEQLNEIFETNDPDYIAKTLGNYYNRIFSELAPVLGIKDGEEVFNLIGQTVAEKMLDKYKDVAEKNAFNSIPKVRKNEIPDIDELDKKLLQINFDKFVINAMRGIYLEGKKPNEIEYSENEITILLTSLKNSQYKFEKLSEKIKKLISDSKKIQSLQRDYKNFTTKELESRLNTFVKEDLSNNERLLQIIIDFGLCKYTEEDKQYLIKFLQILDRINDGEITAEESLEIITSNNIKPHGTEKLNTEERLAHQEKIRIEQEKIFALNKLRQDFNEVIDILYEKNLGILAENFAKYYPEAADDKTFKETKAVIEVLNKNLALNDNNKIKNNILRWEIFKEYSENPNKAEDFQKALTYSSDFDIKEREQRIGQYLLNKELIDNYPASKEMMPEPEILEKIVSKFGQDIHLATIYLSKYEDYRMLDADKKQSIFSILRIFDTKKSEDKILLKHIIENDYVNTNTSVINNNIANQTQVTITPSAKREILYKHKFPNCIELFEEFEDAMKLRASESGTAGIKKFTSSNSSIEYKMELKIMGYPDRLFSSKNNYVFDIYSDKGLH